MEYTKEIIDKLNAADWIALLGIIVNAAFGVWIVKTIQNKVTNRRMLKDYFINEVKDIRQEYKTCLNNIYTGQTKPKSVIPWFKLMNIKVNDLMDLISSRYSIDSTHLGPYQNNLRDIITEDDSYTCTFNSDVFSPSDALKHKLIVFQQQNNHLFNKVIIKINDAS